MFVDVHLKMLESLLISYFFFFFLAYLLLIKADNSLEFLTSVSTVLNSHWPLAPDGLLGSSRQYMISFAS